MSLAEQLELRSNEVAARLEREAHPRPAKGIEDDAFNRQPGLEGPGGLSSRVSGEARRDGRRALGREGDEAGGDVDQRRESTAAGATELSTGAQYGPPIGVQL